MRLLDLSHASQPDFEQLVALDGTPVRVRFRWNARDSSWYMDIRGASGGNILLGKKIAADIDLLRFSPIQELGNGALVSTDLSGSGLRPEFDDFGSRIAIIYMTRQEMVQASNGAFV